MNARFVVSFNAWVISYSYCCLFFVCLLVSQCFRLEILVDVDYCTQTYIFVQGAYFSPLRFLVGLMCNCNVSCTV